MTDRSPLHSDEHALEASTSYSEDGSLGEGKDYYSQGETYSDDYASQVSALADCVQSNTGSVVGLTKSKLRP